MRLILGRLPHAANGSAILFCIASCTWFLGCLLSAALRRTTRSWASSLAFFGAAPLHSTSEEIRATRGSHGVEELYVMARGAGVSGGGTPGLEKL
jgi:hypothetical protein